MHIFELTSVSLGFEQKHRCLPGLGINLTPIEERDYCDTRRDLWNFGKEFVSLFLPKNFDDNYPYYAIFATKMSEENHSVPLHRDLRNCAPEYHMVCGNFQGASLQCFSEDEKTSHFFDTPYSVLKMDPRLRHRVAIDKFQGERFNFALYICDHRRVEPLFFPPIYLQ